MAKKRRATSKKAAQPRLQNTSSTDTRIFLKGMVKDSNASFQAKESWSHARNAINNSVDGDLAVLGNEPANIACSGAPYTIIGAVHLYADQWVIYSTDDVDSEIGRFDDSKCEYRTIVNDQCLQFDRKHLVVGAGKENFDCSWQVYWDDGKNPSRTLNIDNVPYKQILTSGSDPCVVYEDTDELDCEKIRLAPLLDTPCVQLLKAESGGQLRNGAYQAFIAYTVNEQKVTDYIGISNIQTLFDHLGTSGGLNINVSNLDKEFEFFELVILSNNQQQSVAKRIGLYSTETSFIEIDYIDQSLPSIPLELIPLRTPAYEKSDAMFVVNDYLIRKGPYEQFDFNYQPLANKIKVKWNIAEYDSDYYYKGGNKTGLMRDEQYAFFIRWIYNTGERSSSYHIPGRAPLANGFNQFGQQINETAAATGNLNALSIDEKNWQVYNTATKTQTLNIPLSDGGVIIAKGDMGYWESTEKYNPFRPDIWGDLCGLPIRHHKMPTEETASEVRLVNDDINKIRILGVSFEDIQPPVNNNNNLIPNIVGYEILRGSREGHRSILAKGILRNMREYDIPEGGQSTSSDKGLYPNYPYNDLRPDVYFHDGTANAQKRTDGKHNYTQSKNNHTPISGYRKDIFTFHSPELMFRRPFLNAYETRIYGELSGVSNGYFIKSENHPQNKLLRNGAAFIAGLIGVGYAIAAVKGNESYELIGVSNGMQGVFPDLIAGFATSLPATGYATTLAAGGGAALAAGTANGIGNALVNLLLDDLTDLGALYAGGGFTNKINLQLQAVANNAVASVPGVNSGTYNTKYTVTNPSGNLPNTIMAFLSPIVARTNIAIGAQEIVDLFYNMIKESDFAFKHNSNGFYFLFKSLLATQRYRSKTLNSNYIGSSFQEFNGYKVNNLFRPTTVAIATEEEFDTPTVIDKSRYQIGGDADTDTGDTYLRNPGQERKRDISALYGAIKFEFENQYGQLDGIKQVHMRGCVEHIDPISTQQKFESQPIFSGDIYVGRYTEKTIMPIFTDFLNGQPNEFAYDYLKRINIPYPRFWMDTRKFDTSELATLIITLGLGNQDNPFPNDLFYLDRGTNSTASGLNAVFNSSDPNHAFAMTYAYMYTHVNGIQDFYVESEYNLAHRDWEDMPEKRHYDEYVYTDKDEMFHADIIKKGNLYKYDLSLSPSKFLTQVSSFGNIQPRDYDPNVAENCYQYYPKRLLYSLRAQQESKKDFWRVFLPNNYKDFKTKVNTIKPISKSGAMILFPYQSPVMFQGVDTLQTDLGTKVTIGDGGLFNQPLQNIVNSDLSNEYGSSESMRGVINTPVGVFFISQAQGKIFHYTGKLDNIANKGMKQWFNKYLPSILVRQFPDLEQSPLSDNPVVGVGCQSVYDPNYDIVYFTKKDFKLKEQYAGCVDGRVPSVKVPQECVLFENNQFTYYPISGGEIQIEIGDPVFFEDASWTVSYDPKTGNWISFHDWHPELVLPSINHFFTTKTDPNPNADNRGGIWRHNATCNLYANYYGENYPWEVEIIENTGQNVMTLRNVEYQLESYVYKGDLLNGCGDDRWHDLDYNFDEAIIYNSEQISGLLKLDLHPKEDPYAMIQYPLVNFNDIRILYSKEEQKFRFNQFYDITNDRGEFSGVQNNQFITQVNGYIRDLNSVNLNYNKEEIQHKKFRHYYNKILLRRNFSGNRKMLLKLANTKLNLSAR